MSVETAPLTGTAYEAVIGLEVHAQLLTRSKMFCSCSADYTAAAPNANTCPVCLGLPGALPVMNRNAVEMTVRTALSLNCQIPPFTKFDRKNYFYPDLPKGYQISQYDLPLSRDGHLDVTVNGEHVHCGITRVHLEEDTGTMHHAGDVLQEATSSLVDLNRCGVPLMEIVGEPDLRSADAAREYLVRLRQILMYIGVNDGNLEQGSLRCDANVSVRPVGVAELGTKVEVKNMNSFRAVHRAIDYEIERQVGVLSGGGTLVQETRGWVETRGATVSQRSKEMAHDYRYFPEPDLPPLQLPPAFVEGIAAAIPELPAARAERFVAEFGLSEYDAAVLTASRSDADTYEALVKAGVSAKVAANWQMGDVAALAGEHRLPLAASGLGVDGLAALLTMVESGAINGSTAKDVLAELYVGGGDPAALIADRTLGQVADVEQLRAVVDDVMEANSKACADFRGGRDAALQSLVGQVMKATRGRADARLVSTMLRDRLASEDVTAAAPAHAAAHRRGERHTVVAGTMVHGAVCLAHLDDGTPLFLDGALPGERIDVELHHRKGRVWFAATVDVVAPSPHRVVPPCPYYGTCGGCQLQHVDPAHQLELKEAIVRDAMRRQGVVLPGAVAVHGMDDPWRYRWRGEFHAIPGAEGMAGARLGFNRMRSWKGVPVDDCLIHHRRITDTLPALRTLVRAAAGADLASLHLTVGEDGAELLLRPRPPRALSATAIDEHARVADQRWNTASTTLHWRGHTYRVTADTFIQVNWGHLEALYGAALRGLGEVAGRTVVDAYAGVGVLACEIAAAGASVVCIESNRESARLGVLNVAMNGCADRVRYLAEPVETALPGAAGGADVVLLDPPRAGCDPRAIAWLALAGPPRVVYISCDPATLARDLRLLTVSGPYRVEGFDIVDMFPQTQHIESIATLVRAE